MMHARRWCVEEVASAEELARMLTEQTWTGCAGFFVRGHPEYLFLNDATSPDGAAEYGVVKGGVDVGDRVQIESITFSWCTYEQALEHIWDILAGVYDNAEYAHPVTVTVEAPEEHGTCSLCV